jgi:hypothetical protein
VLRIRTTEGTSFTRFDGTPHELQETVMSCPKYEDLKTKLESAQKRYAQYAFKESHYPRGPTSEHERKRLLREERANMTVYSQRISEHSASCPVCKNMAEPQPFR